MLKKIVILFFFSRILLIVFSIFAAFLYPIREGYLGKEIDPNAPYQIWIWANFDGRHFLHIVQEGYKDFNFAFFPLYPFLISLTSRLFSLPSIISGLIVSYSFSIAMIIVLYKIIRLDYKDNVSLVAIFLLSIFPVSYYFQAVYSESVFIFFLVSSFYLARKKNFFLSGVFAALCTLTRFSGIALIPALVTEWVFQNENLLKNYKIFLKKLLTQGIFYPFIGFTGIGIYMLYLKIAFNDPFLFYKSFSAWSREELTFLPVVIYRYFRIFLTVDKNLQVYWIAVLEFVVAMGSLIASLFVWKKVRPSYAILMISIILMGSTSGSFIGTPRYILHSFPLFIWLSLLSCKNRQIFYFLVFVFLVLSFIFTAMFTRGYFVS
ncbi:hypothetical protein A2686_04795 [Candidatus Woesebacteria bacterium RIFCSPHIGHO2_01_FULL_38_10]|uniref:Glycosyltransferase RgtA/B/C/D-like domain-containing protein n=1 Tax=Candidatus Woesebacteria bacterium RIFCSPLOWO2_01_FULL_39_10b TaxID=1802517 RepID=A0A1F8B6A9_9BACT|nr:MAG: hypothetical protein A2686_04795 [Candidatus Woesebacteria bacterium RIFCSPHIGHO2_01_FULL_38_10]OGM59450.1 MAG: hypothetical protein A2892_02270 [Candidatus Woesebacteria bacterium RIFCSPLOWO2_01_FULL_39_10b]